MSSYHYVQIPNKGKQLMDDIRALMTNNPTSTSGIISFILSSKTRGGGNQLFRDIGF